MDAVFALVSPLLGTALSAIFGKMLALFGKAAPDVVKEFLAQPAVQAELQKYEAMGEAEASLLLHEGLGKLHDAFVAFLLKHPDLGTYFAKLQAAQATPVGQLVVSFAEDEARKLWALKASDKLRAFLGLP